MKIAKELRAARARTSASRAETCKASPQPAGWGPKVRAALDKASDKVDLALGLDTAGAKPITLVGVNPQHFNAMEAKVEKLESTEIAIDAATRARLERGEVISSTHRRSDGLVEELTRGVVDVPLERFLAKIPAKDWGKNLVDWKGGEVKPMGPDRQVERMVLRAPGKDLDMTKVETIREERDPSGKVNAARVRWEVLKSDNGSVIQDVGTLRFERFGEKTLVTWHSAHKLDKFGAGKGLIPGPVEGVVVGGVLSDYFKRATLQYRAIASE